MKKFEVLTYDAIVIGTGAAGYNAACRIKEDGSKSVCIVTEGINCGTSRNTGSDKQTYYKLGLAGNTPDSIGKMAENLFSCGSVDGDNALCEAALSPRCFYNLCELGVPFPCNRYGEFIGYKTDHDPFARATSAGPLTSKFMTEVLEKKAEKLQVEIHDKLLAVEILSSDNGVCGLICLDKRKGEFRVFKCANIILSTGGPAGIYADSVYTTCHNGSSGLAIEAGATLQNMTEWQYGLASIAPRWNVSGTYMQVLPRFVSIDKDEKEREFLLDFFKDEYKALSAVFLKGYQWPFDSSKVLSGSSVIDLLVYREKVLLGRRVYLDFTKNPFGLETIEFENLDSEAYNYLKSANACFGTPIERLFKMNSPAIDLYHSKGVDIEKEYLEIALCAQHNNGGIAVDKWWQTSVGGLFAAGECAGTHGITRPGGSALNAGQVGSLRASQYICASSRETIDDDVFYKIASAAFEKNEKLCCDALSNPNNVDVEIDKARRRMSSCGGAIRNIDEMKKAYIEIKAELENFKNTFGTESKNCLYKIYRMRDILTVQLAVLTAMIDFSETVRASRGSALYYDEKGDLRDGLDEIFRLSLENGGKTNSKIQEIHYSKGGFKAFWRNVRPIPKNDDFFENVWSRYRENKNIY